MLEWLLFFACFGSTLVYVFTKGRVALVSGVVALGFFCAFALRLFL